MRLVSGAEDRVLQDFRQRFNTMREDLAAFDADFRATDFDGYTVDRIREWCVTWWEARIGGRILDHSERRLRGTQRKN